jgi:D-glycero-alpha-D-manno-heptose-7-phosphate kinase
MIITRTPLRISFLGGGTDYPEYFETHGGAVLGTAVDKSAYFNLSRFYSRMFDYSIRIAYRKVECVNSIEDLEHVPFRECLRWAGLTRDIEINHSAELPACTGLGSSSSFVVGLLNTAYAFRHRLVHGLDLAYQAIDLERRVLGESVGCQDQTFAAVGGFNVIEFRAMGHFIVHRVPLSPARLQDFQDHLLVVYTGIRRRAEELASRQVKKVKLNLERLAAMRRMVDEGYRILTGGGSLAAFGRLLHDSWMAKRSLDGGISSDAIDSAYDAGMAAGALGGKLLGAGGGGFIAFVVPPERRAAVRARLAHMPEVDFAINAAGSQVVHCDAEAPRTYAIPQREAA